MTQPRSFLFLQGPMGPFFKKLAARLREQGHSTVRVNFNGGDLLHFSSCHAMDFSGSLEEWRRFVTQLATEHRITDLVVYGDCRALHRVAITHLVPMGVRVHVFEEGYFRPNWVTMEEGGVNAASPLSQDSAFYRAYAQSEAYKTTQGHMPLSEAVGPSFRDIARHTLAYYTASLLLARRYPHYCTHRQQGYQKEGLGWLGRLVGLKLRNWRATKKEEALFAGGKPYFLVPLQLAGDSQITHHSPYSDMYDFLSEVLQSFAAHAPSSSLLVVKNHPLDNGLARYGVFLHQKARVLGLEGRIVYIDGGHLPSLLQHARGVVTVNSTAGLSATHHNVPVKLLGKAVYDVDSLADRKPLEAFWYNPTLPDMKLYHAYRHYVLHHAQINGSFYTRPGVRLAVANALKRLTP